MVEYEVLIKPECDTASYFSEEDESVTRTLLGNFFYKFLTFVLLHSSLDISFKS